MKTLKKVIIALALVFVTIIFTETAYGEEGGKLIYYKDGILMEEKVYFANLTEERKAYILLKVLTENRLSYGLRLKYTFLDDGVLCVGLNDAFNTITAYEKELITEQIIKTACSVEGVESIMIYVD